MANGGWQRRFDGPIPLPDGRELVTLRDAAEHITALQVRQQKAEAWQTAVLLVAESGGATMPARIAVTQALTGRKAATPVLRRKRAKKYKMVR
jgi:hypothetical protein